MNEQKKQAIVDLIKMEIDDGNEVAIYRGEDLEDGANITGGIAPVYIGRIFSSAIYELEDRGGGKPLTYGLVRVVQSGEVVRSRYDDHHFDFRD